MTDRKTRARFIVMRIVAGIGLLTMATGMTWSGQSNTANSAAVTVGIIGVAIFVLAVPFCGAGHGRQRP